MLVRKDVYPTGMFYLVNAPQAKYQGDFTKHFDEISAVGLSISFPRTKCRECVYNDADGVLNA